MSQQHHYNRSSGQHKKREEFGGFEAFKKSSTSSTSGWNESVKNQWNDPQRYVQEVSKNYERNQTNDVFDKYKTKTLSDRENDYTSKWRSHQLSPERVDPFASNHGKSSSSLNTNNINNTKESNKRTYHEIYEENKIEREKRNLLYQLKKANTGVGGGIGGGGGLSNNSNSKNQHSNHDDDTAGVGGNNNQKSIENVGINFENSGILLLQTNVVNQRGTMIKWQAPPECKPANCKWIMFEMKNDKAEGDPISLFNQKAWLLGREQDVVDISLMNPSCSKQHAVICFRKIPNDRGRFSSSSSRGGIEEIKPFVIDLQSTNGTFINGERIDDSRYYELKNSDVLTFGQSSREYMILNNDE